MDKKFKILSIDGGGIRGIYSAIILKEIEDKFNIKLNEHFDLIAGTSTGSILAASIATDIPLSEVINLYKDEGEKIFKLRMTGAKGLFKSRYNNSHLKKILSEKFDNKTLSDPSIKTRLLIPTTDISNGDVHVIKSYYIKEFKRDKDRKIQDAVLSSCSAPLYFNPNKVDKYLLADGGLWANNPSLVALTEGIGKIKSTEEIEKITLDNTHLLSIGTGIGHKYYDSKDSSSNNWGFLTKWGNSKLVDTILNLQSINVHNTVNFMLPTNNYLRINFESDKNLSLDSVDIITELESKAARAFAHNSEKIKTLLELED
ncbi:CBASS cGAMP-activated phospholipase [Sulfurospirillum sp. hDNRA2]|uniref:CBASS cGAMP-activated phospholipase n=1 Tax=Sulfurospirillum sp. hDNRA2 TaxID=3237298 RepID=UPI0020B6EB89|nr:CBASS cGAMP-activated phospholipase [Sulfurospirillum sp. DNRA8]MCP3651239.1 patatin-like phospholipase family protein [Sulfurospirillum sp. DNRA8]MCR1810085.1 patatin-like phospholipase family protein [Sulfurospirillum sp. DNRA8]